MMDRVRSKYVIAVAVVAVGGLAAACSPPPPPPPGPIVREFRVSPGGSSRSVFRPELVE